MPGTLGETDKIDAKGLAKLLHLDSLPTVWRPPGEIRDERELHHTRTQSSSSSRPSTPFGPGAPARHTLRVCTRGRDGLRFWAGVSLWGK